MGSMPFEVNSLTNDSTMQGLKMQLDACVMKHQAIASNVANINTPGYKRLDLSPSFQTEFAKAMEQINGGQIVDTPPQANLAEFSDGPTRFDGNNVNMDHEMVDLMNNQSKYDFAAKMLAHHYYMMKMAIQQRSG